jgi:hypothetical protein
MVLIGGTFTNVNGISRYHLARLTSAGELDAQFVAWGNWPEVDALQVQQDDKILVGGWSAARLIGNGYLDTGLNLAVRTNGSWRSMDCFSTQPDGKVLVGGYYYDGYNNYGCVARSNPDGSQDTNFNFFSGQFQRSVLSMVIQDGGRVLLGGGDLLSLSGYLARLRGDAPFIDTQPISQVVFAGEPATFNVSASGIGPLSYQWCKDGSALVGATTSSLSLTNIQTEQTGNYTVVITNSAGSATSSVASLSLYGAPTFFADGQVVVGTATRNYSSAVTMQTAFAGGYIFYTLDGTTPTFLSPRYIQPISITNSTSVRAIALSSDLSQSASSPAARIQILANSLTLTGGGGYVSALPSQPLYERGATVTLTARPESDWSFARWAGDASGTNNPVAVSMDSTRRVQAVFTTRVQTNAIGGGKIVMSPAEPAAYGTTVQLRAMPDPGNVFVVWGGAVSGSTNPQALGLTNGSPLVSALFTLGPAGTPTITGQPASRCISAGGTTTFHVDASGGSALSYQWRLNGMPIPGATSNSLTVSNTAAAQVGDYDVLVTGTGAAVLSSAAKLVTMAFSLRPNPVVFLLGSQGTPFRVDYKNTSSGGDWSVLTNSSLTSGDNQVPDFTSASTQQRFYRTVLLP